jgi:hypothetical protein
MATLDEAESRSFKITNTQLNRNWKGWRRLICQIARDTLSSACSRMMDLRRTAFVNAKGVVATSLKNQGKARVWKSKGHFGQQ